MNDTTFTDALNLNIPSMESNGNSLLGVPASGGGVPFVQYCGDVSLTAVNHDTPFMEALVDATSLTFTPPAADTSGGHSNIDSPFVSGLK